MTALELRIIVYALLLLGFLGGSAWIGHRITARHYEALISADKAAQSEALQKAQRDVIAAQTAQAQATQKAEQQYADLKANYDALSGHLADSVRELSAIHRLVVPTGPGTSAKPDATTSGIRGDTTLAGLSGQAAQACLDDSAHLAALQEWIRALK